MFGGTVISFLIQRINWRYHFFTKFLYSELWLHFLLIADFRIFKTLTKRRQVRMYARNFIDLGKGCNVELLIETKIITGGLRYSLATGDRRHEKKAHQGGACVSLVRNHFHFDILYTWKNSINSFVCGIGNWIVLFYIHSVSSLLD